MGPGGSDEKGGGMQKCPVMSKLMKKTQFFMENQKELGLTDEQMKAIKDLKLAQEKESIRMMGEKQIFMLDIKSKLSEDKVDTAAIGAMIDQHTAAMAKAMKDSVAAYAQLKAIPTEDQMKIAKDLWSAKKSGKS